MGLGMVVGNTENLDHTFICGSICAIYEKVVVCSKKLVYRFVLVYLVSDLEPDLSD